VTAEAARVCGTSRALSELPHVRVVSCAAPSLEAGRKNKQTEKLGRTQSRDKQREYYPEKSRESERCERQNWAQPEKLFKLIKKDEESAIPTYTTVSPPLPATAQQLPDHSISRAVSRSGVIRRVRLTDFSCPIQVGLLPRAVSVALQGAPFRKVSDQFVPFRAHLDVLTQRKWCTNEDGRQRCRHRPLQIPCCRSVCIRSKIWTGRSAEGE
jgi:hypothetical protein